MLKGCWKFDDPEVGAGVRIIYDILLNLAESD
jgi:hypothetical protein